MSDDSQKRSGKVKWFNVVKGYGFIVPDDGQPDVFVYQSVIKMDGFRSLEENELVEFLSKITEKGLEATLVTGPGGQNCKGSTRRPAAKMRKSKCFNCGRYTNHIASNCPFVSQGNGRKSTMNYSTSPTKLCYKCKSDQHLIRDCPQNHENQENTTLTTDKIDEKLSKLTIDPPIKQGNGSVLMLEKS